MNLDIDLSKTDSDLVDAYLLHYTTRDESLQWAFGELLDITGSDPERAWLLTLALIERAPDVESLGYVAAGPLEDLLYARGEQFIDRVEDLARRNPKFRQALSSVYNESEQEGDVADRVNKAAHGSA